MKKILLVLFVTTEILTYAQDKIFSIDGKQFECYIKLIQPDRISYSLEGQTNIEDQVPNFYPYFMLKDVSLYICRGDTVIVQERNSNSKYLDILSIGNKHYTDSLEKKFPAFIVKMDNEIVSSPLLKYEDKNFGNDYFSLGERKIYKSDVMYVKSGNDFFVNLSDIKFSSKILFAKRILKGKINLYGHYQTMTTYNSGGMGTTSQSFLYYNKGFSPLKKAKYKNLKTDLGSNPNCSLHLEKLKKVNTSETTFLLIGAATFIGGSISLYSKVKDWDGNTETTPNQTGSLVSIGIGVASFWTAYFISKRKPIHVQNAIDAYNQ